MKEYFLWLFKTLTTIVLFVFVVPALFIAATSYMSTKSQVSESEGKSVSVIELTGPIVDSKDIVADLYKSAFNDDFAGIVLRIDSPGGAVGPSQEIYEAVKSLKQKKPIVVSMGSVAASGGLYSALSASKIFAQPGTTTGSIGVIMQYPTFEKATEFLGVSMVTVKSGELKDVGNPFRSIKEGEREYLESIISSIQNGFVQAVVEGRKISAEKVKEFADGRIITGEQAKQLGLVDNFGGVYEAARAVHELSGVPLAKGQLPKLYYHTDKLSQFKEFLSSLGMLPNLNTGVKFFY
jgi:protease IV